MRQEGASRGRGKLTHGSACAIKKSTLLSYKSAKKLSAKKHRNGKFPVGDFVSDASFRKKKIFTAPHL
jgi:hypothetical protein